MLLEAVPLNDHPRTDAQIICLGARCCCRAAAGDLTGAHDDRAAIFRVQPGHAALAAADRAIREARRAMLSRAAMSAPVLSDR
jgi:hypothetical protein